MWESDLLVFHRCDPRFDCSTITIKRPAHAAEVSRRAKELGVKEIAQQVFRPKGDAKTAMQRIESILSE